MKTYQKVLSVAVIMAAMSTPAQAFCFNVGGGGTTGGNNGVISGGGEWSGCTDQQVVQQPYYGNTFQHGGVPEWNADPRYRVPNAHQQNVGCGVGIPCSKGAAGYSVGLHDMKNGH